MGGVGHLPTAAATGSLGRLSPEGSKRPQCLFLFARQIGGDVDSGLDQQVAATAPTEMGGTQAGKPKHGSRLRPRRDLQFLGTTFQERDVDLGSERGLGDSHRQGVDEVIAIPVQVGMGADPHFDMEIAWASLPAGRLSATGQSQTSPVGNARRNRDLDAPFALHCSQTAAIATGIGDHGPLPAAG
jgi:hypothetical protein